LPANCGGKRRQENDVAAGDFSTIKDKCLTALTIEFGDRRPVLRAPDAG